MPKNKDFNLRIDLIDQCLRNKLKKWTLESLLEVVNEKLFDRYGKKTSKRTLQDDLRFLREEKSAPIMRTREGATNYFCYQENTFSIKNLPLSDEEINLLMDAIKILQQVNDFKIVSEVEVIINKLQNTVISNVPHKLSLIQFEKHTTAFGNQYIDSLFTAIKEKLCLRITYQSFNAKHPTELIYHPYLLKEYRNRWFLLCRKGNTKQVTTLALDRIKQIKNSKEGFIENDLFNAQTYFDCVIGVSIPVNAIVETIELAVSPAQAPYIETKPIHHSQQILNRSSDGGLLLQLDVIINFELKALLLSYGKEIEIKKPQSLRQDIASILAVAAHQY